jgi:uncharacterized protein YegJ (DUF2314 family)
MLWAMIAGAAAAAAGVFLLFRKRGRKGREIVSVVMLRETPRAITEAEARGIARRVMGSEAGVVPLPNTDRLPGLSGYAVIFKGIPSYYIISASRPYCDDPEGASGAFEDPRARERFARHRAWVSVDVVGGMPSKHVRPMVLGVLGKLSAEVYDEGCTLMYAPSRSRVALPGPEVERRLKTGDPLALFSEDDDLNEPIINVDGDARIERAIQEARRKWPQFVAAWQRTGGNCNGLVKGRFPHEKGNEFMWMQVTRVEDSHVTGTLANRPAHVPGLKRGSTVRLVVDDVVDWAYLENGKPVGMFVERVLTGR